MSVDFAALAEAVVTGLADVRACLLVSRDGLVLAAYPATEESRALGIWSRVATMGDVERGFAVVGDELWAFCRRGPYSALATANPTARAGIVLDRLEQGMLVAEEERVRKESLRQAAERDTTSHLETVQRLRTPLHREPQPEPEPEPASEPPFAGVGAPPREEAKGPAEEIAGEDDDRWVDPIALAREFHGLVEERPAPQDPGEQS